MPGGDFEQSQGFVNGKGHTIPHSAKMGAMVTSDNSGRRAPSERDLLPSALAFLDKMSNQVVAPGTVYHYTTFQGLAGIDSSRQLHATAIRYTNDSSEFMHARKLALDAIRQRTQSHTLGVANLWNQFLRIEVGPRYQGRMNALRQMMAGDRFVVCFSEEGNLLSQWRAYCPDGGVSIGFHASDIRATFGDPQMVDSMSGVSVSPLFARCEYRPDAQEEAIQALVRDAEAAFLSACEPLQLDPSEISPTSDGWNVMMNCHSIFSSSVAAIAPLVSCPINN